MKKIILVGTVACGKTTLCQRLNGLDISYKKTQALAEKTWLDKKAWNKKSLMNISGAGIFAADRAVNDYARDIWHMQPPRDF